MNPGFVLEGAQGPGDAAGVFGHAGRSSHPRTPPPPRGGCTQHPPVPPTAPPPHHQRDSGTESGGYSPTPCGHETTWPYTWRNMPTLPSRMRAPRRPPGREQPPPPPRWSGSPREPSPSPRGPLEVRPRASPPPPPPLAAAPGAARSPPCRPADSRDPGPRALVPRPARPPGIPPARPVPVRFGREGTVWRTPRLHQDSPSGWCPAGLVPAGRGAGPMTIRGSPADFGQPRPLCHPRQPPVELCG